MPLHVISTAWKALFLKLPLAHFIFQSCYYSMMGTFYEMNVWQWYWKTDIELLVLTLFLFIFYLDSWRHYQDQ